MTPTPDTAAPPAQPRPRTTRALARSWREALIPLGAGDTDSIPLLRALSRRILTGWRIPATLVDDVELAVSELATNALIHTRGPVRVRLAHRRGAIRLDVADTSAHHAAAPDADPGGEALHGRGMGIVAALADRVRTEPVAAGRTVGKVIVAEFDLG